MEGRMAGISTQRQKAARFYKEYPKAMVPTKLQHVADCSGYEQCSLSSCSFSNPIFKVRAGTGFPNTEVFALMLV